MNLKNLPIYTINLSRIRWRWVVGVFLLVLFSYVGKYVYEEVTQLSPNEAVLQGLTKTLNAQSYRYQAVAKRSLQGKESIISNLSGEKNQQGVHIKGELPIINAEVEIYKIGDKMYRKDPTTKGWLTVPERGKVSMEELISEINPLGAFFFNEAMEVKYTGKKRVDRRICRVYEIMSRGQNKFMELYWEDFNYRLYIDKEIGVIRKVEIVAEHRDNPQHELSVIIYMKDFNIPLTIEPPI